jgi:N-acetylneuraminic acid mutarotase
MNAPREDAAAAELGDGSVLVAGPGASAELFDPSTGQWSAASAMHEVRAHAVAAELPDGEVLVAGGASGSKTLRSAEIYDPVEDSWTTTGQMATARRRAVAAELPGGEVLVAGGAPSLRSAEIFDPITGTWSPAPRMIMGRRDGAAARTAGGKILVTGGIAGSEAVKKGNRAEIFDPATGKWSSAAPMATARHLHFAIELPGGRVLVGGGTVYDPNHQDTEGLHSAEIYHPSLNAWGTTSGMPVARIGAAAAVLPNGRVLIAGGAPRVSKPPWNSASTYAFFDDLPDQRLTVTTHGTGSGTVTSAPIGIDCGNGASICSHKFAYDTVVTLSRVPAAGSVFDHWTGACTGSGACEVKMNQARDVAAVFSAN